MQTKSLYERLGGYDAIAAVTDDLLARLLNDPQLGVFWKGHSENSLRRDRQLVVNYMCEAAGGHVSSRAAICRPPTKAWASTPMLGDFYAACRSNAGEIRGAGNRERRSAGLPH